jgi:hypothetical protein
MSKSAVLKQNQGFLSTLPIGVIIGWHRDLSPDKYVPLLPPGWVECNGDPIKVEGSPFYGQNTPNLNGGGRFLRGAATSGTLQDDAFQGHHHGGLRWASTQQVGAGATGDSQLSLGAPHSGLNKTTGPEPDNMPGNNMPRTANETRPINMSVIWIMKVKQVVAAKATPAVQAEPNAPLGAVYVDREGNVGVGTAKPDKTLTVKSATNFNAQIAKFADDDRYIGIGRDEVAAFDLSGNPAALLLGGGGKLRINPDGNVGIGTTNPRDTLDIGGIGGLSLPPISVGLGFGKMKSQNTMVPAYTPTAVYSSGNGELIGALYLFVGGGGNSTMYEYRLITNSNGADGTTSKLALVDSLSRGGPPVLLNVWLSDLGPHGAVNVNMTINTATTVQAVFVGLERH